MFNLYFEVVLAVSIDQLVKHYGSIRKVSEGVGVTYEAVRIWVVKNKIPYERQCVIEVETNGALKAERSESSAA